MGIYSRQKGLVLILSVGLTALLLGALAGAGVVFRSFSKKIEDPEFLRQQLKALEPPSGPVAVKPALVRVAHAEKKTVLPTRTLVGRLVEVRRVVVCSELSGKIIEFPLEEGDLVEGRKTLLARIDDIWARLAFQQQQAQWLSTSAQLEYEKGELQRLQDLFKVAAVTESELHQKQTQIVQLEAKLQELQAAMAIEQERQKRSCVYAPFDGVVVAKHAELGQYVQPGSPLVEMISRGQIDAQLMVPESVINYLRLDQTIYVFVDPLGEQVEGKVVSITPFGPTASRSFPVRIRIDDPSGRLKVGMSITARIPIGAETLALVVPKDAVLEKPDEAIVWVVVPGASESDSSSAPGSSVRLEGKPVSQSHQEKLLAGIAQPVPVSVDIRLSSEYAITPQTPQGTQLLKPSALVVIEGGERLSPGQRVQILR